MSERRVVITGMGVYSCIGQDLDTVRDSLYAGKSGIGIFQERLDLGYKSGLSGILPVPNLKGKIDRRSRVCLSQEAEYAYLSTLEALSNAKIDNDYLSNNEVGIVFGNDSSSDAVIKTLRVIDDKHDTQLIGSSAVFQTMNSSVSMNLSTIFSLTGINFTVSAACSSGTHALGVSTTLIRSGMQDMIICGGAQEVNEYSVLSFDALGAFSNRMNEPKKASRPFDRDRDGLVPSGGSATLILEELEHAKRRGAPILGEVIGYGVSSNGGKIQKPGATGTEIAIRNALRQAGISPTDVDYINAHATSTPLGDSAEAKAINAVFGEKCPYVSSTKSMTGHECWMAGASEIVYSLLMMNNGFVAPNINFENPDEDSAKLNIPTSAIDCNIDTFLSNSFGFGGTNAVLVVRRFR